MAHRQKVSSLSLFYRYCIGRCSPKLAQLVPLPFSQGRSTLYFDKLHDFFVTIPRCYKDVYVSILFPCTAKLWNSLSIEWFPLTYDLNDFNSRINKYLLTVGSFKRDFLYVLILSGFLLVTSRLAVAVQPCMEWIPIKEIDKNI